MIIDRNPKLALQLVIENAGVRDTVRSLETTRYVAITDEPVVRIGWSDLANRHRMAEAPARRAFSALTDEPPAAGLADGWERADEFKRLFGRALA